MLAQELFGLFLGHFDPVHVEEGNDGLELLGPHRVYHVCDSHIVVNVVNVFRVQPEDAIVEKRAGEALLELVSDAI